MNQIQKIIRAQSRDKIITQAWDNCKCFFNNCFKPVRDGLVDTVNDNLFQIGWTLQPNSCAATRNLGHHCCSLTPPLPVLDVAHERQKSTAIPLCNDLNTITISE